MRETYLSLPQSGIFEEPAVSHSSILLCPPMMMIDDSPVAVRWSGWKCVAPARWPEMCCLPAKRSERIVGYLVEWGTKLYLVGIGR